MDNLNSKTKKAFAWDFSGRMISQGVSFIISMFLARLLTPADFGLIAMVNVIIAFSGVFMDMGLGVSLIQRKDITDEHYGSVFWFNVFVGALLTALLYLSAPFVVKFYNQPELLGLTHAMSFIFIINAFGRVISAKLTKALDFKRQIVAQLIAAIISGVIGIVLAFQGKGVWALVIQSLIAAGLNNILLIAITRFKPAFKFSWKALKELWGFGFRMFISGFLDSLYNNLDAIIIGKLFNASSLGFYNRAKNLKDILIQNATGSLNKIMFPSLSALQLDYERFNRAVSKSIQFTMFVSMFVVGLFFVISKDAILLLFGNQWEFSVHLFRLILLSAYAFPVSVVLVNIIAAKGNSKAFLRLEILKKLIQTLNFVIGFIFGIEGFIIGLAIVSTIGVSLNIYFASKETKLPMNWFNKKTWHYLLISGVLVAIPFFAFDFLNEKLVLHALLAGGTFSILYFAVNKILKTGGYLIFMEELKNLRILDRIRVKFIKTK